MISPIDLFATGLANEAMFRATKDASVKLLSTWRESHKGRSDEEILREILVKCGWKYDRRAGRWHHPNVPDAQAPRTLPDLAVKIATVIVRDVATGSSSKEDQPG